MIQRVTEMFVPAAINLYRVREATDGSRELFLSLQGMKDQYQGIWIVSPEGKVLSGRQEYEDFSKGARELLETIDAGLKAFGPVEPRPEQARRTVTNPLPFRGNGVQPEGSVEIALYVRQMLGGGRDTKPADIEPSRAWLWDGDYRTDGPPVIDSVKLSSDDWSAIAPAKAEPGAEWLVPEKVSRVFTRLLTASSDQSAMPLPKDAMVAELKCMVDSVSDGLARIRLAGRWEMVHAIEGDKKRLVFGAATARGTAVYDIETKSMRSFRLVFDGTARFGRPDDPANRTGAVAEWNAGR